MRAAGAILVIALLSSACGPEVEVDDLRERIEAAGVFTPRHAVIGDEAEVALGQALFFDPELSGNRNIACATCHLPELHAVDGHPLGRGQGGDGVGPSRAGGPTLPRAVIGPFNRSLVTASLWDGRVELLEDGTIQAPVPLPDDIEDVMVAQALMPLLDRDEMRGYPEDGNELATLADDDPFPIWDAILTRLLSHEGYVRLFAVAYPGQEPSITLVGRALVAFQRQIWEVTDTRFDAFVERRPLRGFGSPELDVEAMDGADLFFGDAGCTDCHDGPLLSDMRFHNIGVPQLGPGKDPETGLDEGRYLVTGDPADRFAFRTPPLRNVELTGPFMHDGAFQTLEQVVRHHANPEVSLRSYRPPPSHPGEHHDDPETVVAIVSTLDPALRPRDLSEYQVNALVAFLRTLSSETELNIFPGAGVPPSLPSGLPPPSNP